MPPNESRGRRDTLETLPSDFVPDFFQRRGGGMSCGWPAELESIHLASLLLKVAEKIRQGGPAGHDRHAMASWVGVNMSGWIITEEIRRAVIGPDIRITFAEGGDHMG